ncbi:hypothetical protein GN956_G14454 [Arapaima gigas]
MCLGGRIVERKGMKNRVVCISSGHDSGHVEGSVAGEWSWMVLSASSLYLSWTTFLQQETMCLTVKV